MACCKAEEYDWCADLETVEHEGAAYCIFHAPAECAEKQDVEAFNQKVFQRIDEAKEVGKECDLSGTIFPGDILFSHYDEDNPLPSIWFREAAFCGEADFIGAYFSGEVDFKKADFKGEAKLWGASLSKHANFSEADFKGEADFGGTAFRGATLFGEATFRRYAYFREADFSGNTDFTEAAFSGEADFQKADFKGAIGFIWTAFRKPAFFNRAIFHSQSLFVGARFKAESYFRGSGLGKANFNDCQFEKPAFLRKTTFTSGNFDGCFVNHRLEFDQADLSRVSFAGAPLEDFRFIDCKWPMSKGRRVVYDARLVDGDGYYPLDNAEQPEARGEKEKPPSPGTLADIFRRLKKIATTEQDHALASDWHFNEKDMVRRAHWTEAKKVMKGRTLRQVLKDLWAGASDKWRWFRALMREDGLRRALAQTIKAIRDFDGRPLKSIFKNLFSGISLELYRASSGYGERPQRALFLLLALVALPIIFADQPAGFIPLIPAKAAAAADVWLPLGKGLWRLLITVQAGMFALAVRNRMRR